MSGTDPEDNGKGSLESKKFPQYLATLIATLITVSAGTYLSWTSGALPLYGKNGAPALTENDESWVGSLLPLGALVGALPAGWLAGKVGRKIAILIVAVPLLLSWFIIGFAPSALCVCVGRFIAGAAIGAVTVTVPMYISEIGEPAIRGSLGSLFQLQITIGVLLGYLTVGMIYHRGLSESMIIEERVRRIVDAEARMRTKKKFSQNKRIISSFVAGVPPVRDIGSLRIIVPRTGLIGDLKYIALSSAVFPALLLIVFPFMPESPVWLLTQGRLVDAENALQRLRGKSYRIQQELDELQNAEKARGFEKAGLSDLKYHKRAVLISLGLMVFQQLSGINAVVFYAGEIFKGEESLLSPTVCSVIMGVAQCIATYASTLLVDRAGRKILLIISSSVMSLCLFALALNFYFTEGTKTTGIPWIPLISLTIYMMTFATGFGPIPWLMVGEVSATNVVGIISSIAATLNWTLAFTVTKVFGNMKEVLGTPGAFGVFSVVCATGTIFVATIIPETKGRTRDVIQMKLHRLKGKTAEVGVINRD